MATSVNDRNENLIGATLRVGNASVVVSTSTGNLTIDSGATVTTPGTLTLTTVTSGYINPTYTWYQTIGSGSETLISGATSATLVITGNSTFITAMGTATTIKYRVSVSETGRNTSTAYRDVPVLRNGAAGASAIYSELSNSAHPLPADSSGNVTSYVGSGTTVVVKEGNTLLTYNPTWDGTTSGFWKISSTTAVNITVPAITDSGAFATVPDYTTGVASGTDTSSVTFNITGKSQTGSSFTLAPKQTFSKSKAGSVGLTGDTAVTAYQLLSSTSLPSAPSVATGFNGANKVPYATALAVDGLWHDTPPGTLAANIWCFQASGTKTAAGVYTWTSPSYLATFKVGALSALSASMGSVQIDSTGALYSAGKTTYASNTPGYYLGYSAANYVLNIGNIASYIKWSGDSLQMASLTPYYALYLGKGVNADSAALSVVRNKQTTAPSVSIGELTGIFLTGCNLDTDTLEVNTTLSNTEVLAEGSRIQFYSNPYSINTTTVFYVRNVNTTNNTFQISATLAGALTAITVTSTADHYAVLTITNTHHLMLVEANTSGAAINVKNINGSGGALGAYGYTSGTQSSAVVLGQGDRAVHVVQGGIRFNADSSQTASTDVNTLDDYEEGTWTPALSGGSTGITWGTKLGTYTKVGNLVTFSIYLPVSSVSSPSGDLIITNLPFTVKNNGSQLTAYSVYAQNLNTSWSGNAGGGAWGSIQAASTPNSTNVYVRRVYQGNEILDMGASCNASSTITISGSYLT